MPLYASELEHLKEWLPEIAQTLSQMRAHSGFSVSLKGHNDLVTTADLWSENKLIELINNQYPNDVIWAEETHHKPLDLAGRIWIIDPIDGTTNFAHGFAPYCISVALWKDGQVVVGMVYEMAHHQCFYAVKHQGAFLNGKALSIGSVYDPKKALIATGFPYTEFHHLEHFTSLLKDLFRETHGVRRAGAASYDLCAVAAGWVDAFFEEGLKPWDVAAGALIVQEAGGEISDWKGGKDWLEGRQIIAANPTMKKYLLHKLSTIYPI